MLHIMHIAAGGLKAAGGLSDSATKLRALAAVVYGALFFIILGGALLYHMSIKAMGAIFGILLLAIPVAAAITGQGLASFFTSTAHSLGL